TATVSIIIAQRTNTVKVPNAALRFRPPEAVAAEMKTNAAPQIAGEGQHPGGGGPGGGGRRGGGAGGGAGGGGRGPGGANRGPRPERQMTRTVYVLPREANAKPKPVQIKVGISDGAMTEVLEGLSEGDQVVTGM